MKKMSLFVGVMFAVAISETASADCTIPPLVEMQDSFYSPLWGCTQSFVDDSWSRFAFHSGDWDQGFGFEAPCDNNLPLKRTFNALFLLAFGVTTTPTCSISGNVAVGAHCWAGNEIDELDARCPNGTNRAMTQFGVGIDNWTQLYLNFFYSETVVERAATIFHEARHADGWCKHEGSCLGGNCDKNWSNGCTGPGSSSGKGANAYTVLYLNWFTTTARSNFINSSIRANAVDEGNFYLANRFQSDPCKRMDSNGFLFQFC